MENANNNLKYIYYTYRHKQVLKFIAKMYLDKEDYDLMKERIAEHDMDKMIMYLFYDKPSCSKIHKSKSSHHACFTGIHSKLDYIEMVLDWESARYTKPDKPLNAYDTLYKYYPEMVDQILPILQKYGLDQPNTPPDLEVVNYAKTLEDVSSSDVRKMMFKEIDRRVVSSSIAHQKAHKKPN